MSKPWTTEENRFLAATVRLFTAVLGMPQKNLPINDSIWGRDGKVHQAVMKMLPQRSAFATWEQLSSALGNDTWKAQEHQRGYSRSYVRLQEAMYAEKVLTAQELKSRIG
jgi:hypothetical protein